MMTNDISRNHYKHEAEKWGDSSSSTMEDEIIRQKETDEIVSFFQTYCRGAFKALDIGCGNGYSLELLSRRYPDSQFWGVDITPELLSIADNRGLPNCQFVERSATSVGFTNGFFDCVYTQRCIINVLDWNQQKHAIREIHRVLKPSGYYLMIECFTDGLENYNKARRECGLSEIKEAAVNKYIEKELFLSEIQDKFFIIQESNFLSTHYFISRVLHALVTKGNQIKNTEFVKFFSFLPPIGNYSPIQAYILQKIER